MNKEYLEAFDRIALHTEYDNDGSYDCVNFEDDCKLVDDALERLEEIDNANPSTALELVYLIEDHFAYTVPYEDWIKDIEKYILKAQKEHRALEIIKGKEVNMQVFNQCEDAETYNKVYIKQKDRQLTGEEFETLKEVEE